MKEAGFNAVYVSLLLEGGGRWYGYFIVHVQDFCAFEAVESCRRGYAVGTDVFGVETVADLQVRRQLLGQRNLVEAVTRRADYGTNLRRARLRP